MRVVIIDNESDVRELLSAMIKEHCWEVDNIGEASGVISGVNLINELKPELVFLDIEMDDGTGFDLLRQLSFRDFQLIFVTAHDQYALQAFKHHALHYLLKPISKKELIEAVARAKEIVEKQKRAERITALLEFLDSSKEPKKIVLKDLDNIHLVNTEDIIWCEADGSYTRFRLTDKREFLVSGHLKEYENLLPKQSFYRPHNSFLININHLIRFEKADGGAVVMSDDSSLPVSVRKKDGLMERLHNV